LKALANRGSLLLFRQGKAPPSQQTTESANFKMKYVCWRILSQPRLVYTRRLLLTDPPIPKAKV
jgi:hypothetical protein